MLKFAYGIVGMADVGKTVALRELAYRKDARTRFPDDALFMTLSPGPTVQTVLRELSNVLSATGAVAIVATVKCTSSMHKSVDAAVPWFLTRDCLFLFDNL